MTVYEAPNWDEIYNICLNLAFMIIDSKFKPDLIAGVARGGWIPARLLSDFLDNPNVANVKVEFYIGIYKTKEKPVITQDIQVPVRGKKVLLVDDVADTGKSLKLVKDRLLELGASEVKVACMYYKPWSILKPDFYVRETEAWVIFPHEIKEAATKIWAEVKTKGGSLDDVEKILIEAGVKPDVAETIVRRLLES